MKKLGYNGCRQGNIFQKKGIQLQKNIEIHIKSSNRTSYTRYNLTNSKLDFLNSCKKYVIHTECWTLDRQYATHIKYTSNNI